MKKEKIIYNIYALFLLMGAFMGLKAGSEVSFIMAVASSGAVFLGVYLSKIYAEVGYAVITYTSGYVSLIMLMRLIKTMKMMPSGMVLIFSLVVLFLGLKQLIKKQ